jgi:hypothetical protein
MERIICSVKVWESGCCEDVEMGGTEESSWF